MTYAQNAVAAVKEIRKTNLQFLWAPLGLRHYSKKVFAGEHLERSLKPDSRLKKRKAD